MVDAVLISDETAIVIYQRTIILYEDCITIDKAGLIIYEAGHAIN